MKYFLIGGEKCETRLRSARNFEMKRDFEWFIINVFAKFGRIYSLALKRNSKKQ